jgi:hypothetical protein
MTYLGRPLALSATLTALSSPDLIQAKILSGETPQHRASWGGVSLVRSAPCMPTLPLLTPEAQSLQFRLQSPRSARRGRMEASQWEQSQLIVQRVDLLGDQFSVG